MTTNETVQRECITVEEAAIRLGISHRHAYKMTANGTLPSIRLGGRIVIPRARFEAFLKGDV